MGWMSTMPPAHCNIDCKNDPDNCMSETFYKKIADILGYPRMAQALNKTGRPIVFGTEWAAKLAEAPWLINYTLLVNNCNVDRIFEDIKTNWFQIMLTIDWMILNQDQYIKVNGPGYWNDPDTFQAGFAQITLDQARAQMSIWSIWSVPLVMSADLRNLSAGSFEILTNKNVIAVDQDPLGIMGRMIKEPRMTIKPII
uniref:Alpha-galactosidase n=1 Tax=Acrobeloides nanus TaxID=290746 RepID=A0A914DEW5_9BILA